MAAKAGQGDRGRCFEARTRLRAAVEHYCAHHRIDPPYQLRYVFSRPPGAADLPPGRELLVPRRALVDLDDDEAWLVVCPCDRRWWDVDLYPALAADNHAAGFTASTETAAEPVTTPAGIYIHQQPIRLT